LTAADHALQWAPDENLTLHWALYRRGGHIQPSSQRQTSSSAQNPAVCELAQQTRERNDPSWIVNIRRLSDKDAIQANEDCRLVGALSARYRTGARAQRRSPAYVGPARCRERVERVRSRRHAVQSGQARAAIRNGAISAGRANQTTLLTSWLGAFEARLGRSRNNPMDLDLCTRY
jgi:hypothetical protein